MFRASFVPDVCAKDERYSWCEKSESFRAHHVERVGQDPGWGPPEGRPAPERAGRVPAQRYLLSEDELGFAVVTYGEQELRARDPDRRQAPTTTVHGFTRQPVTTPFFT